MGAKDKIKLVNWEKITVYLTISIAFLAVISHLFQMKDEIRKLAVDLGKVEVKIEKLEEKK